MSFEQLDTKKTYLITKQHLLNTSRYDYWLYDAGENTPYEFICPNCKASSMNIDIKRSVMHSYKQNKCKIGDDEFIKYGGAGLMYSIIKCTSCMIMYYIGIGHEEPNYGRDVYLLHTILEIEEK